MNAASARTLRNCLAVASTVEWTDNFTLLEITKSDHVGLSLRTADCSSGDERRLQNGSSTSSFTDLIFSLGTTEAGELGDVNPVNGGGG